MKCIASFVVLWVVTLYNDITQHHDVGDHGLNLQLEPFILPHLDML